MPRGNQPLWTATRRRDAVLARRALNFGADLHEYHPVFGSLTIAAVRKKDGAVNMDLVELLLEFGADPAAANEYDTLLTAAASDGSVDIMRLLLDTADGPRIIHVLNCQDNSALHEAAHHNHVAACQLLLDRGAKLEYRNKPGDTPLFSALSQSALEAAELLLAAGADLLRLNHVGEDGLELAIRGPTKRQTYLFDPDAQQRTVVMLLALLREDPRWRSLFRDPPSVLH